MIKNFQPFGKKNSENHRGDFFDSHCRGTADDRNINKHTINTEKLWARNTRASTCNISFRHTNLSLRASDWLSFNSCFLIGWRWCWCRRLDVHFWTPSTLFRALDVPCLTPWSEPASSRFPDMVQGVVVAVGVEVGRWSVSGKFPSSERQRQ